VGCGPAQAPPRYTKCSSPSVNGKCTNFILFDVALLPLNYEGLKATIPITIPLLLTIRIYMIRDATSHVELVCDLLCPSRVNGI